MSDIAEPGRPAPNDFTIVLMCSLLSSPPILQLFPTIYGPED
jgi:hypothetical protein